MNISVENIRSTAGYQFASGQPTRGKARQGGESIGGLDVNAHLSYGNHNILKELLGPRSDNISSKIELTKNLQMTGSSKLPDIKNTGQTNALFNIFMISQGLYINTAEEK